MASPLRIRSVSRRALLLPAALFLALLLRWPLLFQLPELNDETSEVWRGYLIYRGELRPLTNITSFVGPLWNYMLAGLFLVTGPSLEAARVLIMLLGALTVVPVYLFGREIGGQRAGLIGALLLAVNGGHIVSNSHYAWSNCMTPLFGTTGMWMLARAVNRSSGGWLVGGALLSGVALLTHGTYLFLLPGLAAFALWRGRRLLRTRWLPLAALAFLLGFWPLIAYNLGSGARTVQEASSRASRTREGLLPAPAVYAERLGEVTITLMRLSAGAIGGPDDDPVAHLGNPLVLLCSALAAVGLVLAWRAGQPLPGLVVISGMLIWPLVTQQFESLPEGARYLMPMMPSIYLAMGLLCARGLEGRRLPVWAVWGLLALMLLYALVSLTGHYRERLESGRINEVGYAPIRLIEASRQEGERVLLDAGINRYSFGGNGGGQRSFSQLFGMRGIPVASMQFSDELTDFVACGRSALVLLRGMEWRKLGEQAEGWRAKGVHLTTLSTPNPPTEVFGIYRVTRDPCPRGR